MTEEEPSVHFSAMASSPLGRMRSKVGPPTPVNPKPALLSRPVVSVLAADPPGPGRTPGSGSLAWDMNPGLVAEGEVVLAVWGFIGVVGLVRPRLARASRVPSGSTITLITVTKSGRELRHVVIKNLKTLSLVSFLLLYQKHINIRCTILHDTTRSVALLAHAFTNEQ